MGTRGWIGVDLDGTLARYDQWVHELHIGEPIAPMVERIKGWLSEGREVRIFTARVCEPGYMPEDRSRSTVAEITAAIQDWTEKHIGARLPVTNIKDFGMVELWDDRAVRVPANSGHRCCEPVEAGGCAPPVVASTPRDEWRPIETAPKGTMILLADMTAKEARHWAFVGWKHNWNTAGHVETPSALNRRATHWKPLPPPPEAPHGDGR